MPNCGSQCYLCDYPIRFDTYKGCSHGCKYCFIQKNGKAKLGNIKPNESVKTLSNFINGQRNKETMWADWNIPLHWGGMSDPFQPVEREYKRSFECLKLFAETKYPFIVSTKGRLAAESEYLEVLKDCNCVFQVSAVCSKYDSLELGAPAFDERLKMMKKIAPNVKRLIVRAQPYMHEVFDDVCLNLAKIRDAGAYGIIIEGMKFFTYKKGLVKIGGDFTYPYKLIREDFLKIKEKSHSLGLKIFAGENRIRELGDSLSCCGAEGVPGFVGNKFNLNHIIHGEKPESTEMQKAMGSAECFTAIYQDTIESRRVRKTSFYEEMLHYYKTREKVVKTVFGIIH